MFQKVNLWANQFSTPFPVQLVITKNPKSPQNTLAAAEILANTKEIPVSTATTKRFPKNLILLIKINATTTFTIIIEKKVSAKMTAGIIINGTDRKTHMIKRIGIRIMAETTITRTDIIVTSRVVKTRDITTRQLRRLRLTIRKKSTGVR